MGILNRIFIQTLLAALPIASQTCWRNTVCNGAAEPAFPGPWDVNNFAPSSRSVHPKTILSMPDGGLIGPYEGSHNIPVPIQGVVFDFGLEVGGIVSLKYQATGRGNASLGLAFTEAKDFIGRLSDSSNGGTGADGALVQDISTNRSGVYTMPDAQLRGGFRYLTVFLDAGDPGTQLTINDVTLEIAFQPTWSNLRAYKGYFHSSDELLNRIWYSGAYTLQTNSVPANTGRVNVKSTRTGWDNRQIIGPGATVLLDGAKRDRWVWIGDMGTAVPSAFVSTGELESTMNALRSIWDNQASDGTLPKHGPPSPPTSSDTYHMWALIGTYNYYLYTKDDAFLQYVWPKYLKAMDAMYARRNTTAGNIITLRGQDDWGRWTYAPERASGNMLFYRSLRTGALLASWASPLPGASEKATQWATDADAFQKLIMQYFWDDQHGAFKESPNDTTSLYPQDGNAMALAYGVVAPTSPEAARISDYLASNWSPNGPSCPELKGNVSPFISSIELEGHFRVGRADRAVELMRTAWGWYINHPNGTQSTTAEGWLLSGEWTYRGDRGYRNDPKYMSHAHCWSSGPTSTLTEYLVGLQVVEPAGRKWELRPVSFAELEQAEAGFSTPLGKFSAKYAVQGDTVLVQWDTPEGTVGSVKLPGLCRITVKGGKGEMRVLLEQ